MLLRALLGLSLLAAEAPGPAPVSTVIGLTLPPAHARAGWVRLEGPLWGSAGPSPEDVFQGHLEDCALLARMAGLAAHHPDQLRQALVEQHDGRIQVTLHPPGQRAPVTVIIDRLVPAEGGVPLFAATAPADYVRPGQRGPASANRQPIWPAMLEKAVAVLHGGYAALDGESIEQRAELDGSQEFTVWLPKHAPEPEAAALREAIEKGCTVELGNAAPERAKATGLKPAHGYAVLGLRQADGRSWLRLRNPTGEGPGEIELGEALKTFRFMGVAGQAVSKVSTLQALRPETKP